MSHKKLKIRYCDFGERGNSQQTEPRQERLGEVLSDQ